MLNIKKISPQNSEFLQRLQDIDTPPKCLWYVGKLPSRQPTVAIVGSRKPTSYGRAINIQITSELAQHGVVIVSGLAIGHDGLAHQACLDAGGTTIAVLGSGLEHIYPARNHNLANSIIENGGVLISEYEPTMPVLPHQFLERNRLISGLADIVIVIEAGERSGTLNTASHALVQGRDIMAVPGNITSPLSRGCNQLIAQGATPLLSAQDVLDRLHITTAQPTERDTKIHFDSPDAQLVYNLILDDITDGDQLLEQSRLAVSEFTMALTMLELNGYIQPLGGNKWGRK
ncbi:MAG: DNA-processing protein DprA [Candidatus Saccharibacteria bacterium]|nr:DNA-processing protein DprA [Candidatus Saccharibacteria bacterium]